MRLVLFAECKLLAITDQGSDLEKFFVKHNMRGLVTSWNFDDLIDELKYLLDHDVSTKKQRQLAREHFDISAITEDILLSKREVIGKA